MTARIDNRLATTPRLIGLSDVSRDKRRAPNTLAAAPAGAKVLLLSHVFMILIFALVAWAPLLLAQNLLN